MNINVKVLVLCFFFSMNMACKKEEEKNYVLDNIKNTPEWLKLNVEEALPTKGLCVWVPSSNFKTSSLLRVPRFPRKFSQKEITENPALTGFEIKTLDPTKVLTLSGVKNEQVSAQISVASDQKIEDLKVTFTNFTSKDGEMFSKDHITTQFVKFLPIQRARSEYVWSPKIEEIIGEGVSKSIFPNIVGDALVNPAKVNVPSYRAQPIWFTFKIPENISPGVYKGEVIIKAKGSISKKFPLEITIIDLQLPKAEAYQFHLDLWVNPSSIAGYYKIENWSNKHWTLIEKYLQDYASRGGKNITTTITHEPWRKPWLNDTTISQSYYGYKSMVQWSKDKEGNWSFDYTIFDKYVALAQQLNINEAINAYSLTPFLTKQKIYYYDALLKKDSVIELSIEDEVYKKTWTAFLKSFKKHLIKKGWFDKTYLAFDEKPDEVLKSLQELIKRAAPEFLDRIIVAGHPETTKYAQNLSISYMFFPDQPLEARAVVPVLPTIDERNIKNQTTTFYLCAEPSHPNSLTYSPAIESQMIPWLALKYNTDGYLRWAYNNWTDNPYEKPIFIHNQGDDYLVYPGKEGPTSSIRWELLKEGIEDFELFKIIQQQKELDISDKKLQEAIEVATRNQDGRYKSVKDYEIAKEILMNLLKQ